MKVLSNRALLQYMTELQCDSDDEVCACDMVLDDLVPTNIHHIL